MIASPEKSVIPLFDRMQHHSSIPITSAMARNGAPGQPRRRRKSALPLTAASSMACFRFLRFAAFLTGVLLRTVLPSDAMAGGESTASGPRSSRASPANPLHPLSPRHPVDLQSRRIGSAQSCNARARVTNKPLRPSALSA
jgi:hypothetical protein